MYSQSFRISFVFQWKTETSTQEMLEHHRIDHRGFHETHKVGVNGIFVLFKCDNK